MTDDGAAAWPAEERAALRAAVAAVPPVDARSAAAIARIMDDLERLARPLDEQADPTHVTASAVVAGPRGVLLHRHRLLDIWLQPGGHVEPGEHPSQAAVRETLEETGLAARHPPGGPALVHVDVHPAPRGHTHLDLRYLLHAGDADPDPPPQESQAVAWFTWDEAVAVADAALVGALRALRPRV